MTIPMTDAERRYERSQAKLLLVMNGVAGSLELFAEAIQLLSARREDVAAAACIEDIRLLAEKYRALTFDDY